MDVPDQADKTAFLLWGGCHLPDLEAGVSQSLSNATAQALGSASSLMEEEKVQPYAAAVGRLCAAGHHTQTERGSMTILAKVSCFRWCRHGYQLEGCPAMLSLGDVFCMQCGSW